MDALPVNCRHEKYHDIYIKLTSNKTTKTRKCKYLGCDLFCYSKWIPSRPVIIFTIIWTEWSVLFKCSHIYFVILPLTYLFIYKLLVTLVVLLLDNGSTKPLYLLTGTRGYATHTVYICFHYPCAEFYCFYIMFTSCCL